jgi:hypothetical protein
MKTIRIITEREVARKVRNIKRDWSPAEKAARHEEAERRQRTLASILGFDVADEKRLSLYQAN